MLRKSFDEDSEFQNKLNFAKHKPIPKKKQLMQANNGAKTGSSATEQLAFKKNLSISGGIQDGKLFGVPKVSIVS